MNFGKKIVKGESNGRMCIEASRQQHIALVAN